MNQKLSQRKAIGGVEEAGRDASAGRSVRPLKPLRVLIVAPSIDILGGQAVQAARLLEGLRQEPSLAVDFLPINPRLPGPLSWLQRIKYVRTIVTSMHYGASLLLRVRKYDLIHIFSAAYFSFVIAPTPAMLLSRLYGKRIVLNYHSGEATDHLSRWRRTAIPTIRLADAVIVQSEYLVKVFARFGLKARAVFNNLETERFRFRERPVLRPIFLVNRNLEPHYNVGCVLRAFARIQESVAHARLIVVGDGKERVELEELSRRLGLSDVEFRGQVTPDVMAEVYDEADVYLNASEIDSMPISILEAFASGLPVVTTEAGGIPFIVTHEKTGLLVPCGDHEALADGALRLLKDGTLASSLSANARSECEKYSWSSIRDEWLRLYREVALAGQIVQGQEELNSQREPAGAEHMETKVEREVVRS